MTTSGEVLANNLKELIDLKQVSLIQIYMYPSEKMQNESTIWSFSHEYVEVGGSSYNLNRILKYECINTTLALYFLVS